MENLEFKLEDLWPIIGMNTLSKRNKNTLNTSGEGFIIKSKKDYRDALKYTAFCAYQAAAMMIISTVGAMAASSAFCYIDKIR